MNDNKEILVIDGHGGKLGEQLVEAIRKDYPTAYVKAVGTNSIATARMNKLADRFATGENAVVVACRTASVIVGPVGIAIADSLDGEVTPKMALAVSESVAVKLLVPINRCNNVILGVANTSVAVMLADLKEKLSKIL